MPQSAESDRLPVPPGWVPIRDDDVVGPGWVILSPLDRLNATERKLRAQLERDPGVIEADEAYQSHGIEALLQEGNDEADDRVIAIATKLAGKHRPSGVQTESVLRFLLSRWFSRAGVVEERIATAALMLYPIRLVANISDRPYRLDIRRGEFGMRFAGATGRDRRALDGAIEAAQATFGYASPKSTREPNDTRAEQAKTVAKLVAMGWTGPEIGAFMGWAFEDLRALDTKVQRLNAAGVQLMRRDDPEWPHGTPPPIRGPARRSGLVKRKQSLA